MNNLEFFNYKSFNKKNFNISCLLSKKFKIDNINIKSLQDIARISELFSKEILFSNLIVLDGNYEFNIETLIECIENGGQCLQLNLIFGLLLQEFNIDVQLIKSIEKSPNKIYPVFQYHFGNVIKWNQDNRLYFHDIGLGFLNHYYPIEIGNQSPIIGFSKLLPNSLFRVIENNNNQQLQTSYLFQKKDLTGIEINQNNIGKNCNSEGFISIYEFNLNSNLTIEYICDCTKRFKESSYGTPIISKLTNDGYYLFLKDSFSIISPLDSNIQKTTIQIKSNEQLQSILLNNFNLNINNFKYFILNNNNNII